MRLFGLPIPFTGERKKQLSPVDTARGWFPLLRESFPGAWQTNTEVRLESVLSYHADFACRTLIASDISKLRLMLVRKDDNGIWTETTNPAYSPVLRKPNRYQTRGQFFESWVLSKLQYGNTYVLKQRDARNVVVALYVLDPTDVTPLVADSGDIFYELRTDHLAGLTERVVVPAREIIHDRFNCFFHPLVGLSPIFASGLASMQGLAIQNNSTRFFQNGSQPGGILTAPGAISDETAGRLKVYFDTNFSGTNRGKIAVAGDGLKYESMAQKAVDAQLIEQLKWTAEVVCGVYHVPAFMAGVGSEPSYNNVQNLTLRYYSQCLQVLIEAIEACLDEGLGMDGITIGTEFNLDDLLRMDTATQVDVATKMQGIAKLNEQRLRLNLPPDKDANTIFLQQQDHSIAAIAARDAQLIENINNPPAPNPAPAPDAANDNAIAEQAAAAMAEIRKGLADV